MIQDYVALDLETSGLNPASDKIIEIGMAKVVNGQITEQYNSLIDPGVQITDRITQLTGITNQMVEGQPRIEEEIVSVLEFIGDLPILGHNVIFDYSFLKKAAVNNGLKFEKKGIDTLKIARRLLPDVVHKNLEYLCQHFQINPGNSHRAFDDACSAMLLYGKLHEIKPDDDSFETLIDLNYNAKKDVPITAAQKRYLKALTEFYSVTLNKEMDQLTKSKASKLIDGIIAEYGKMPYHSK